MEQRQIHDLRYRLKKSGLIEQGKSKNRGFWRLTKTGESEIATLESYFAWHPDQYKKENDTELKIVAFDIPEKYIQRRNWLRETLKNLGFTMLQKSVWVGKCKLPQEFLDGAHKLGVLPYIEIVAVTKTGSLKDIT